MRPEATEGCFWNASLISFLYFLAEVYFASEPSTPKGSSKGAQLYASYMAETHHRKLRKGQSPPPHDAAGESVRHENETRQRRSLLQPADCMTAILTRSMTLHISFLLVGMVYGTKFHGRMTPLKGHGLPPPEQKEDHWEGWNSRALVPGRSFFSVK